MFQDFRVDLLPLSSFPDLEMRDKDGARDVVRLQEGAQTGLGWWRGAPEDPVGQIDKRGPEIWDMGWGPGAWSEVPGAQVPIAGRMPGGASGIIGQVKCLLVVLILRVRASAWA